MERITSRANPLMVHIRKLAVSRAHRYETKTCLGDGVKLLEEALRWQAALTCVVYTPETVLPPLPADVRQVEVPPGLMRSISPMETPQGVLFLARLPSPDPPQGLTGRRYLALEGVQDPGNVGTILRTADAFEADGLFLLPGCADPGNPKSVRASMGAFFRRPVWQCDLPQLRALAAGAGLPLLGTALRADTEDIRGADMGRAVVLLGSEGRGLSEAALSACQRTVRIPMGERCESLNVAAAAAVLLWEGYARP